MSDDLIERRDPHLGERDSGDNRNMIVVFVGFLLLGAALGLLLFGGDLFSRDSDDQVPDIPAEGVTILSQVDAIPTLGSGEARIIEKGSRGRFLAEGDQAYDFTLNDFEGNPVSLSDFRGQPAIVNFWATWCAPCRIEMPALQATYEKYQDHGLVILALDQDEPLERAREFFYDEMGLTFIPLIDENSAIATAYGSFSVLPTTYFIDDDGLVAAIHRGPLTMNQIDGYLARITTDAS